MTNRATLVFAALFLTFGTTCPAQTHDDPTWLDRVQIYTLLAVPLDDAKRLGVTVNGLWNGWGMTSPVKSLNPELILWRFLNDEDYVSRIHEAGMLHATTLSSIYCHSGAFQTHPELKEAVCRKFDGDIFQMGDDGSWYIGKPVWMCQNSPAWRAAVFERAKKAVQAGTDAIVLDEPFGDTFFGALPVPEFTGFSKWDMQRLSWDLKENFDAHTLKETFGLSSTDPQALREKLAQVNPGKWLTAFFSDERNSDADRLLTRFQEVMRRTNFEQKKWVVEAVRKYSRQLRGNPIPIGANLAELENFSLGALPVAVLYLAELCDFLAYEQVYRPPLHERMIGGEEKYILPPRGKWMSWHKLGAAIVGPHRSLALPSQKFTENFIGKEKRINYLCHLLAEAYAGLGALVLDLQGGGYGEEGEAKLGRYTRFVKEHADFFENLDEVAPVGILYAYDEKTTKRQGSYIGLAQALYESGVPFSVIYTCPDCDRWRISPDLLKPYKVLFIPFVDPLNEEQRKVIERYEENGEGIVVEPDPDLGLTYYETWSDDIREDILDQVPFHNPPASRDWSFLAYAQPEKRRAVIHVLNYDYMGEEDAFHTQRDIVVHIDPVAYGLPQADEYACTALSPDHIDPVDIPCVKTDRRLKITLPALQMYEVLIVVPK